MAQTPEEREALLKSLQEKHTEVFAFEHVDAGLIVFRRPTRLEFRQYKRNRVDDEKSFIADEELAQAVVVYPEGGAFSALMDRFAGLSVAMVPAIQRAAGMTEITAKKH